MIILARQAVIDQFPITNGLLRLVKRFSTIGDKSFGIAGVTALLPSEFIEFALPGGGNDLLDRRAAVFEVAGFALGEGKNDNCAWRITRKLLYVRGVVAVMSVNISVAFDQEPMPGYYSMVMGGIRVEVDETVLTRFINQDDIDWASEWQPDYIGEYIHQTLVDLLTALQELKRGDVELYEQIQAEISPVGAALVFEPLSEREVRLAFQSTAGPVEPDLGHPPSESALGYLVDIDELCEEAIICADTFIEYADGRENVRESTLGEFSKLVNEFKLLTENFENKPEHSLKSAQDGEDIK